MTFVELNRRYDRVKEPWRFFIFLALLLPMAFFPLLPRSEVCLILYGVGLGLFRVMYLKRVGAI